MVTVVITATFSNRNTQRAQKQWPFSLSQRSETTLFLILLCSQLLAQACFGWVCERRGELLTDVLVAQVCQTLWNPVNSSLCWWNSPGKNTGVGRHFLLQGIFPDKGSNRGLLHYRWILYQLSHRWRSIINSSRKNEAARPKQKTTLSCGCVWWSI